MHIVQIVPELNQGGVERGTVELSRELVARGHRSTVITAGGELAPQIAIDGGEHIVLDVCSKNPFTAFARSWSLRKTLKKLEPDIVHPRSRVPAWLLKVANQSLNIPVVTTVHGFNSVSKYSEIMTKGQRVIFGSSAIKDYVLKHYTMDESILRYVPRGIDMQLFDPADTDSDFIESFKTEYDLHGKRILTMVGRITEWKGHESFIRALAEIQKRHPDVIGVVAGGVWHGKDEFCDYLKQLAIDLGATVRFTGSQSKVREIYALSDLFISAASTKAETFGRTAAEALAMNTPVVASAHGGSLDILIDGENGLLFEPGNAEDLERKLETALSMPFSNLREHIDQHFSLKHMVDTELAVYHEIVPADA